MGLCESFCFGGEFCRSFMTVYVEGEWQKERMEKREV